ncbi:hypothetical protein O0I10_005667 [Lichtheimia ornata]|uniref:Zn(2)-C6 fungal-type domain-containing protein n=1 Tax=Lichtheimia ornata TaxID=688661 RepID=A0AAD7Y1I5_9FUNG|nr:uncharacterized protein O0I10_005667 [Lichtheimia ornata]KAJ8658627.1 hypothetical protein O0I10_005667 [Lichtheimia ornata]
MQDIQFNNFVKFDRFDASDTESSKRKKASRACFHCQKAHLTCDDSRPCQRCIKRGLAATCTDAIRKKAKYLQDQASETTNSGTTPTETLFPNSFPVDPMADQSQSSLGTNFVDTSQFLNLSLADLQELGFGSESAGLEYGFIGNMLQNPLEQLTTSNQANDTNAPSMNLDNGNNILSVTTTTTTPPTTTQQQQQSTPTSTGDLSATFLQFSNAQPNMASYVSAPAMTTNNNNNTTTTTTTTTAPQGLSVFPMPTTVAFAPGANPLANDKDENASPQQQYAATIAATPPMQKSSPSLAAVAPSSPSSISSPGKRSNSITSTSRRKQNTPESVYLHVKRPFNYAEGFHYLIEYVKERMNREDLMRISRALALFRPSFLALIMNLTEEDLVFMEKCIQRTLLEYEKLISFSGTPTVVWRRTGEVCLVGKEFLLLTQWPRDTLLNKKTYIYELMDNRSAVEYWEKFSTHAFDNTDKSCMYSCILKTPHQKPVPCTFCFTIKRDIFDLPSVIVGNFLPILS